MNPAQVQDQDAALAYQPIHLIAEGLRTRVITVSGLVDCYLKRIHRFNEKLNAFVDLYETEAREAAALADAALKAGRSLGPLHGVPIAFKDLVDLKDKRTTGGSLFWRDRVSTVTATVAQRLAAAGMITLGKTHMVEFAFGAWGTNSTMGTPWNPWDARTPRSPGGSSSGSGVAVAAALAPAAIGSDTGGSVRIPASLCGVVGLKPTVGRVSNYGTLSLSETLDTIGPITRDVEDAALLFATIHGPDCHDVQTLAHSPVEVLSGLKVGVAGLRFAVLPEGELGKIDAEVARAFAQALDVMRGLGARVDTIALPVSYARLAELTGKIIAAEGYALHRAWIDRDELPFDSEVRKRIRSGKTLSAADYLEIMSERNSIQRKMDSVLSDFDALLLPTTPLPAVPLADIDQNSSPMSMLTRPVNLLGLCALAVPCGFTTGGLPISLQIIGRGNEEARVLRVGWAYENATKWHERRPPL